MGLTRQYHTTWLWSNGGKYTNKIMNYGYHFPPETIEYLAGQFDSNVRDLEGLKDISLVT